MTDKPNPDVPASVASQFAGRMRTHGLSLDFSVKSLLSDVDEILLKRPLDDAELEMCLSAYVGEALVRLFHGKWEGFFSVEHPVTNFYTSWVKIGEQTFWPSHFPGYRLKNGPSEGSFREYIEPKIAKWTSESR